MPKRILLTGGGRGLGRVTAEKLAALGHHVVLMARTPSSARSAVDEIRHRHPDAVIEPRALELSSLAEVRAFATHEAELGEPLDVLFHIAGVMPTSPTRILTVDGYEQTLAVNVLAPFLLTSLLLTTLARAPSARVVSVSSRLHMPGSRGQPVNFDFDDPQLEHGYNPNRAYKNSKLAVLWFTYELQRRLGGSPTNANAVCPGFVPTTAAASTRGLMRLVMTHVMPRMPFATSVDAATDSLVYMAVDPSLDGVGGQVLRGVPAHRVKRTVARRRAGPPVLGPRRAPHRPCATVTPPAGSEDLVRSVDTPRGACPCILSGWVLEEQGRRGTWTSRSSSSRSRCAT